MSLFAPKGGKGLKFQQPGTSYSGTINAEPYEEQQKEYGSDRPATYPNGDPKMQILVNLDTQLREEADDDGRRTLYVNSPKMKRAIFDAITAAGENDLKVGGTLTVTFTGFDPNSKNPQNPAKLYSASYVAPQSAFSQGQPAPAQQPAQQQQQQQQQPYQAPAAAPQQVDPWNAPPQQPYQAPAAAPAPAPATTAPAPAGAPTPGDGTYEKVQALINGGFDDTQINGMLGTPVEQVAAIRAAA